VEDQRPGAGDLTDAAVEPSEGGEPTEVAETVPAPTEDATEAATESAEVGPDEVDEDSDGASDAAEASATDAKDGGARKKWLAGKRLAIAVAVAAVLFVGSAAFAGAAVEPYLTDRATEATKLKVAQTAANAIRALWTYTPENMDTLADRASVYLSGDFEAQYRKFVDAIAAPNKQAKVTNTTDVTGAAVESLDDPNAIVIVYTNTTSTSPLKKNIPSLKYLSYRIFMKRNGSRWLVTRMNTITSLDLTPHL
jgi:Mce-associated membrane protein